MTHFHPDSRFLSDYASGSLPASQGLCVATHLHYCEQCKNTIAELTGLASTLFADQPRQTVSSKLFDQVVGKISQLKQQESSEPVMDSEPRKPASKIPKVLQNILHKDLTEMDWNKVGRKFRYSPLNIGDKQRETSLFYIDAGGKIPKHSHKGDEITVVLKGSFSDQDGCYRVGDFIVRGEGEKHTPVASQDEDCLCLSTLDAPISMSNWLYKFMMPFLRQAPKAV